MNHTTTTAESRGPGIGTRLLLYGLLVGYVILGLGTAVEIREGNMTAKLALTYVAIHAVPFGFMGLGVYLTRDGHRFLGLHGGFWRVAPPLAYIISLVAGFFIPLKG